MADKIMCIASAPSAVPGFWNKPQFSNPKLVTGFIVTMGEPPKDFVDPCKPAPAKDDKPAADAPAKMMIILLL